MSNALVRITAKELIVGVPIQFTAYDAKGHLLLREGSILQNPHQIERLLGEGLYRKPPPRPKAEEDKKNDNAPKRYAMEEIRLRMGDPVQLQTNDGGTPVRYSARFMGYLKGKSVLISAPVVDGKYALVREGQAFIVRVFSGKDCYAFSVSVLKSVNVPYPYLHVTYPGEVMGMTVRRHARVKVRVVTAVAPATAADDKQQLAALITNMSTGGASLSAKQPLGNKGEPVIIKFKLMLAGLEHVFAINAILRSIVEDESNTEPMGGYVHGVEFVDLSPRDAISLSAYIYSELAEHLADTV